MEVRHRQELGFALGQPLACGSALTLGAVPIAAAIVGDDGVSARLVLTAPDMAAERRRAAALNRRHDLHLAEADMAGIGLAPRCPMVAEDSRDLQQWMGHGRYAVGWSLLPLSLALFGSLWLSWASYEAATAGQAGSRCRRSGRLRPACSAPSYP